MSVETSPVTHTKRHQLRGGFECIFVKDPPEQFQTECSVCLCVLREPYLLDCCGYSFCRSCIEPIKADRKPCPLCAVHFTTCIPDKRLQRTLNDFQVYCSHRDKPKGGCEWIGKLANLAQHLNANPLDEGDRLSGCQLTSLECKHCGECFERQELEDHETSVCSQRPYSCEYCRDFKSTFEEVTSKHLSVCLDRPAPCPNGCGSSPLLKLLEEHRKECPLEVIECTFDYAGCSEKLPRKDMPEHLNQSLVIHMSLQAVSHRQEVVNLKKQISELKEGYEHLQVCYEESRAEVAELKTANQKLVTEVGKNTSSSVLILREEIKKAKAETKQEITKDLFGSVDLHNNIIVPFTVTMTGFEQKKLSNDQWYSPPFFTHPRGYKMCLEVYANGNDLWKNNYVSVSVCMMKGEYDESLKWPFKAKISIKLLNGQTSSDEWSFHHLRRCDTATFPTRVLGGRCQVFGFGNFINHKHLPTLYLNDDCLNFCVDVNLV